MEEVVQMSVSTDFVFPIFSFYRFLGSRLFLDYPFLGPEVMA